MSSALSSAKNRRANQPPAVISQGRNPQPQTNQQTQQQQQINQPTGQQSVGLSLQQVIEIYGRRLNQLEAFMNKTQSQQIEPSIISSKGGGQVNSGPSLTQIQDLIDAKIRDYNDLLYNELQPLREAQSSSKEVVSEADFSEFHSRCQMLAEEIFQIKDMVLKLQSFTMSVNQKLLEKTGVFDEDKNKEPEGGLIIPVDDYDKTDSTNQENE